MTAILRQSLMVTLLLALLCCGAYPLLVTGLGQAFFPEQAGGSLVVRTGKVVGSHLIGQQFTSPQYFHGRPSAAGTGYDGLASGGSNLGPTSKALAQRMEDATQQLRAENPGQANIPVDLITASGSGLDPHISLEAAMFQVNRVALVRGMSAAEVTRLIQSHVQGPELGFLGPQRVNVLELNLALDEMQP